MRTRYLGRSGVSVGEIGLGTWSLSGDGYGPCAPDEARRALAAAVESGSNFIETADCYAEGRVESMVGDLLRDRGRGNVVVSTRVGVDRSGEIPRKRFSAKYVAEACEASLKRLGTHYVDALVLHNPQIGTLTEGEATGALEALKKAGKVRLMGASVGSVEAGVAAVQAGVDLLVVPYNILYSRLLHGLSSELSSGSVAVVARSPLGYGVLADTWGSSRRFRDEDHRMYRWSAADLARRVRQREALRPLVHGDVKSIREAALRYVLANGLVSVAVPGARTAEHARQNAKASDTLPYLPEADLVAVGRLLASADP